ncbi:sporulation YhaL family protein [Niallia taxi]|uniref:SigE-dependent sporulation protein n=1 Tax=Niallia taxi TaxID=2499688 RepID=A0A3S3SNS4_9BACI|nr:sporulation YhaL family protein [Niallia taxi]MCM3216159.1 sporulation YhaL family protein [Niallia taxi]MED4037062.1 sporulation YhaL family protein [Niallia taxi]MED4053130.1 sporulation YhaL family protein [Niallia taxi]MED4118970.1 sporulation YhaL family protein [Niallia taxi]RVT67704.1 SigE-dependent sporulation protein [Niallia taxi]
MFEIPMWVLFVLGGIVVSAFMAVKSGKEDRQQEQEIIEREGEVYIRRMEEEKHKKIGSDKERVYEN